MTDAKPKGLRPAADVVVELLSLDYGRPCSDWTHPNEVAVIEARDAAVRAELVERIAAFIQTLRDERMRAGEVMLLDYVAQQVRARFGGG